MNATETREKSEQIKIINQLNALKVERNIQKDTIARVANVETFYRKCIALAVGEGKSCITFEDTTTPEIFNIVKTNLDKEGYELLWGGWDYMTTIKW